MFPKVPHDRQAKVSFGGMKSSPVAVIERPLWVQ
jgi:hypothetical protein